MTKLPSIMKVRKVTFNLRDHSSILILEKTVLTSGHLRIGNLMALCLEMQLDQIKNPFNIKLLFWHFLTLFGNIRPFFRDAWTSTQQNDYGVINPSLQKFYDRA